MPAPSLPLSPQRPRSNWTCLAQPMTKPLPCPWGEMHTVNKHSKGTASLDCQPPPSNLLGGAGRTSPGLDPITGQTPQFQGDQKRPPLSPRCHKTESSH